MSNLLITLLNTNSVLILICLLITFYYWVYKPNHNIVLQKIVLELLISFTFTLLILIICFIYFFLYK